MAARFPLRALIVLSASLLVPSLLVNTAHAEGASPDEAAPHRVVKKKAKPKPKPAVTPSAPVPYAAIAPQATPAPVPVPPPPPVDTTPVYATVTVQASPPVHEPVQAPAPTEVSLRCETRVTEGKKFISQGVFYIQLFPSDVFPDEQADFRFLFVDPGHRSLIRETLCLDITCPANVTKTAYGLINRPTKKGNVLRITLDRTKGAFYAEDITKSMTGTSHLGESGWCRPEALPKPLF